MIRGTIGQSALVTQPDRFEVESWAEMVDFYTVMASIERHPDTKTLSTPFVSPFLLRDGAPNKCREHVVGTGRFFGTDLDHGWSMTRVIETLVGLRFICHTTTQSVHGAERFRTITLLSRELVNESEHLALWEFHNDLFAGCLDPKTRNWNRLLYVPARWHGADNGIAYTRDGVEVDVDEIVRHYHVAAPVPRPPVLRPPAPPRATSLSPSATVLITLGMETAFRTAPPGGRLWKLLIAMASRVVEHGWATTADEIATEAARLDDVVTKKKRKDPPIAKEAARALAWAEDNIAPLTAFKRLQRKIEWKLMRRHQ